MPGGRCYYIEPRGAELKNSNRGHLPRWYYLCYIWPALPTQHSFLAISYVSSFRCESCDPVYEWLRDLSHNYSHLPPINICPSKEKNVLPLVVTVDVYPLVDLKSCFYENCQDAGLLLMRSHG